MASIHTLRLGTCNAYLLPADGGYALVDAGNRHKTHVFKKRLDSLGIAPKEIRIILISHVHFDHVGSCMGIKSLTHAKVLVHTAERDLLERGIVVIPPGITFPYKILAQLGTRYFKGHFRFPPCPVDIEISEKTSLKELGIDGTVLPTPGHTKGSLSFLLKSGEAFVGDLALNYLPWGIRGYLPPFGESVSQILDGWDVLLRSGAKIFYPAHGFPIPAAKLLTALNKHRHRLHG